MFIDEGFKIHNYSVVGLKKEVGRDPKPDWFLIYPLRVIILSLTYALSKKNATLAQKCYIPVGAPHVKVCMV